MPTVIQEKGRSVYVITRIYWIHVKTEVMVEIVDDRLILDAFMILNSMTNAANSYRNFFLNYFKTSLIMTLRKQDA